MPMTAKQSRAARELLGWKQSDLAEKSLVGLSTIKSFEGALRDITAANYAALELAFGKAGIIFEADGKFIGVKVRVTGKRGGV